MKKTVLIVEDEWEISEIKYCILVHEDKTLEELKEDYLEENSNIKRVRPKGKKSYIRRTLRKSAPKFLDWILQKYTKIPHELF